MNNELDRNMVTPPNLRHSITALRNKINMEIFYIDEAKLMTRSGIDKIGIIAPNYDEAWIKHHCGVGKYISSEEYRWGRAFTDEIHGISFQLFKEGYYPGNRHHIKLEINPFNLRHIRRLDKYLRGLLGQDGYNHHRINRIDISLLLQRLYFNSDLFKFNTFMKGKHEFYEYPRDEGNGSLNGIGRNTYVWGIRPHRLTVYEKDLPHSVVGFFMDTGVTNFEIQFSFDKEKMKSRLNIVQLKDLKKLLGQDILMKIYFYNVFNPEITGFGHQKEKRINDFLEMNHTDGFHKSRKHFQKNKNWDKRDLPVFPEFRICNDSITLHDFFIKRINRDLTPFFSRKS
jgi:hypothetical protein